jgi:hypothetical protein
MNREAANMPRAKRAKPKDEAQHTFISIRVTHFDVSSRASINYRVENPKYAFGPLCQEDLVFNHITSLKVCGEPAEPSNRGTRYELSINTEYGPYKRVNLTLGDIQARNKHGTPMYREYRGRTIPVVEPVSGISLLNRNREGVWTTYINVVPRLVSDMLAILNTGRPTWVSLHEVKTGRVRWIRDISIQTTDPAEE